MKKSEYGTKSVLKDSDFESSKCKVRVSTFIDLDIIDALRDEAEKTGEKYQLILNRYLRQAVMGTGNK